MAEAIPTVAPPGPDARIRPAAAASPPPGVGPDSPACWEVDLSQVQLVVETVARGGAWPGWVADLLHGARIVAVNARGLELVGAPVGQEAMLGQPVASFCPPESWEVLAELIAAVAADSPGHAVRRAAIDSFMFRNAILSVWGTPGAGRSERLWVAVDGEVADERSFWAVRASEQRYRRLLKHLPGALLQVDARAMGAIFYELRCRGVTDLATYMARHREAVLRSLEIVRVTDANEGAARLFGAESTESLIGPLDHVFAAAPDAALRTAVAHFEGRRSHVEVMKLGTRDGRLLDVQLSVTFPTPPERLDVTLLSLEDVTDRLRTEAQLRQLQADYSRAARIATLGELASSIAHEVNQPLSAIAMNAETSLRWLSRGEPNLEKVGQLTGRIAESARHASEIVQRIRGMAARHVPERVPVDLNHVVAESLLFVRHDLESRAIALETRLDATLPPVLGDRVQLQQVIVNLLVNSVQALTQGGAAGARIALDTRQEENAIAFSIRDNGPGIAEANLERVFDGFFTTKEDGMGIGLAVCQSIIAAHGGRIVAANHPDGGAIFRFSLPLPARGG